MQAMRSGTGAVSVLTVPSVSPVEVPDSPSITHGLPRIACAGEGRRTVHVQPAATCAGTQAGGGRPARARGRVPDEDPMWPTTR